MPRVRVQFPRGPLVALMVKRLSRQFSKLQSLVRLQVGVLVRMVVLV